MDFRDRLLAAAALIAVVMLFSGLGSLPLMQPDEGRNAEVAREMAISKSWLVPTLEGHPYLDKPAAYFAAVAVSLRVFGVNEWGARMPSAVCGLLILVLLYVATRRYYGATTAALVVIVVATSPLVFAFSRIVIMDIALALCTTAAILAAFRAEEGDTPDPKWHTVGAAAAGVGTLIKGPVGALVPAIVAGVYFLVDGRPQALRRAFAPRNVIISFGVFLPWLVALCMAHPEFLHYGFVDETFNRFFTSTFNRGQPIWFFGPVMLEGLFPWTLLFVPMAFAAVSARKRLARFDRLLIVWAIVVLIFFSLSRTKQPGYILPGIVAAAVCVGRGLGYAWQNPTGRAGMLVARTALVLAGVAFVLACTVGVEVARGTADLDTLGMKPDRRALWQMWPAFELLLGAIVLLGLGAYARRRPGFAVAAFVVIPLALTTIMLPSLYPAARARSAQPVAESLDALSAGTEIACLDGYPAGLSFYLGRTLTILSDDAKPLRSNFILYWLRRTPERPPTLVARNERDAWLASRQTDAFVLAPESSRSDLDAWLGSRVRVHAVASGWWGALVPRPEGR